MPNDEIGDVLISPDGDPLKTGTITSGVKIGLIAKNVKPTPPPLAHPASRDALLVVTRSRGLDR